MSSDPSCPPPRAGRVFWLCGLSGAGKSTLATALAADLRAAAVPVLSRDGDRLRSPTTLPPRPPVAPLAMNDLARVAVRCAAPVFPENYRRNRATGSVLLIDPTTQATVAAGLVLQAGPTPASCGSPLRREGTIDLNLARPNARFPFRHEQPARIRHRNHRARRLLPSRAPVGAGV